MRNRIVRLLALVLIAQLPACSSVKREVPIANAKTDAAYEPSGQNEFSSAQANSSSVEKPYRDVEEVLADTSGPEKPRVIMRTVESGSEGVPDIFAKMQTENTENTEPEEPLEIVPLQISATSNEPTAPKDDVEFVIGSIGGEETKEPEEISVRTEIAEIETGEGEKSFDDRLQELIVYCEEAFERGHEDAALREHLVMLYMIQGGQIEKAYDLIQKQNLSSLDVKANLISSLAFFMEGEYEQGVLILENFTQRLNAKMPLTIKKALFADPVDLLAHPQSFGRYEDLTDVPLGAGDFVGIYTELEHFTCQKQENGSFKVSFNIMAEIYDDSKTKLKWKPYADELGNYSLDLKSRIRDTCPTTTVYLPSSLPEGAYVMRVIVKDNLNLKKNAVEKDIPFTILNR